MKEVISEANPGGWPRLRPLKRDEVVRRGDFVKIGEQKLEPWVGPGGFRADSFVNPIYRLQTHRPVSAASRL